MMRPNGVVLMKMIFSLIVLACCMGMGLAQDKPEPKKLPDVDNLPRIPPTMIPLTSDDLPKIEPRLVPVDTVKVELVGKVVKIVDPTDNGVFTIDAANKGLIDAVTAHVKAKARGVHPIIATAPMGSSQGGAIRYGQVYQQCPNGQCPRR